MDQTQIIISTAAAVLSIVGRWLLFRKAGIPGWHSIIPFVSDYQEYSICWKGGMFLLLLLFAVIGVACLRAGEGDVLLTAAGGVSLLLVLVIHWKQSMKLSKAFGKGFFMGLILFFLDRLGRTFLGLSKAEYVGKK